MEQEKSHFPAAQSKQQRPMLTNGCGEALMIDGEIFARQYYVNFIDKFLKQDNEFMR